MLCLRPRLDRACRGLLTFGSSTLSTCGSTRIRPCCLLTALCRQQGNANFMCLFQVQDVTRPGWLLPSKALRNLKDASFTFTCEPHPIQLAGSTPEYSKGVGEQGSISLQGIRSRADLNMKATCCKGTRPGSLLLRQPVSGALYLRQLGFPPLSIPQQQVRHAACRTNSPDVRNPALIWARSENL